MHRTAAGIIIGDEILSGKVRDTNTAHLIESLAAAGVALRRIVVIADEPALIAAEVRRCAADHDYVFTSGGIGPTHDDRTMEGVALAFGLPLERHPALERMIRAHWKERINEAALKLAEVPRGAELIDADDGMLPVASCRNVYILPGIPQMFRAKLARLTPLLDGQRQAAQSVYLSTDETSVAALLDQVDREFEEVTIGSYPRLEDPRERVRVTVQAADGEQVAAAVARLLELLPAEGVVRVDPEQ